MDITSILNQWASYGVFSYVFPFLIIFAIVFGILQKTGIFGEESKAKGINAVIAIAVGFLSLLNDYVSTFFATILPRFGIALIVFLVILIMVGLLLKEDGKPLKDLQWVGWVLAGGVILWAWSQWGEIFGYGGQIDINNFIQQYGGGIILLVIVGLLIFWIIGGKKKE